MSFLDDLRSQAAGRLQEKTVDVSRLQASLQRTETACNLVWSYVSDLAKQLNVIEPQGPELVLDRKAPWPPTKLVGFRADVRRKGLSSTDMFDYITITWRIVPLDGGVLASSVSANFPPDLERIESRLAAGAVKHDRINVRHPEKKTLQEVRFEFQTEARGGIHISVDYEAEKLDFRLNCLSSFRVFNTSYPAAQIQHTLLDEMAKTIVGQRSSFCLMD